MLKKVDEKRSSGKSSSEADDNDNMAAAPLHKTSWNVNDRILCKCDGFWYEGKIVTIKHYTDQPAYIVGFTGWGEKYDEEIIEEEAAGRIQAFSEVKMKEEKERMKQSRESAKSQKRKSSIAEKKVSSDTPVSKRVKSSAKKSNKKLPGHVIDLALTPAETPVRKQLVGKRLSESAKLSVDQIQLTEKLKNIIETDRAIVLFEKELPILPARFTVQDIIEQYVKAVNEKVKQLEEDGSDQKDVTDRFLANKSSAQKLIAIFTEDAISKVVLSFEQPMFTDLFAGKSGYGGIEEKEKDEEFLKKDISAKLGIVYLLRILARLHQMTDIAKDLMSKNNEQFVLNGFVDFLDEHAEEFYRGDKDYYKASVAYIGIVYALERNN